MSQDRIHADVTSFSQFIEELLTVLAELNDELEGQKAGKHFIIQLKTEIDKLKQCFSIVNIMSCTRLKEWHWQKMSDIVGFDLSQFADATVLQISELGINQHVSRLKPIVYIAEREGIISDQTNYIVNYWTKATFVVEGFKYWDIELPSNLKELINATTIHIEKLKASYDIDNTESSHFKEILKWVKDIKKINKVLMKWNKILIPWKNISIIMERSYQEMSKEFHEFRTCAKYWSKFSDLIKADPRVLKILKEKHVECWLNIVSRHVNKLIAGCDVNFNKIRHSNPRLSMLSDNDMLILLSNADQHEM